MTNKVTLKNHKYIQTKNPKNKTKYSDGYYILQRNLSSLGWFVGWALPCDKGDALSTIGDLEVNGLKLNYENILFNHEQCCSINEFDLFGDDWEKLSEEWEDVLSDTDEDYQHSKVDKFFKEIGYQNPFKDRDWVCSAYYNPNEVAGSVFYFTNAKELEKVLPIIEKSGCAWEWDKKQESAIEIFWN